jgi:UV DNA damage endonuclease
MLVSNMTPKIGFACKWLNSSAESKDKKIHAEERELNSGGTTVAWLKRQTRSVAEDKLWSVVIHNLNSIKNVLNRVKDLDPRLHMMRIGSDILPMYTEPTWRYFCQQSDVKSYCEREFAAIGEFARQHNIRLSFHPGQFCVLASSDPNIVMRSIDEFEYHVDMARMMGYGKSWHDHGFKINVHIAGREGPAGVLGALHVMSPEARNLITIENDEMTWGIDASIELADHVALVLDIHHHLIHDGEYIQPTDDRWRKVVDSWRGVRPTMHYSLVREDVLPWLLQAYPDTLPPWDKIQTAYTKTKLRAHSDDCWLPAFNNWALSFWSDADIMVEAKWKNLASKRLLEQVR